MQYDHTQTAPLYLILGGIGVALFIGAWLIPNPLAQVIFLSVGGLMFLTAMMFRQLTVRDEGEELLIQFGPIPLFKRRMTYSNIVTVAQSRTTIFDGWGIHPSPSGGWTWNLWGFDCVDVTFKKGRKLRIGTDSAEELASFLKQRTNVED